MAGPYIHYNYKRYLNNGIEEKEGASVNPASLWQQYHNVFLNNIKNSIVGGDNAQLYETLLNGYYKSTGGKIVLNQQAINAAKTAEQEYLNEYMSKKFGANGIKPYAIDENGKVYATMPLDITGEAKSSTKQAKGTIKINLGSIGRKIEKMLTGYQKYTTQMPALKDLENMKKEYETIVQTLISENQRRKGTGNYDIDRQIDVEIDKLKLATLGDFRDKVNAMISVYNAYVGGNASSFLTGRVTEVSAKILLEAGTDAIQEVVDTSLEPVVKEIENIGKYIGGAKAFTQDVTSFLKNKKGNPRKLTMTVDGVTATATAKQGKADLVVTNKDGSTTGVSIKGYSLGNPQSTNFDLAKLTLLTGSNVLQIFDEGGNFSLHYLNIVPERAKGKNAEEGLRKQWHNLGRAVLAARGLIGQANSQNVGVLAIKNVSTGEYKCYPTSKIVDKIFKNLGSEEYSTGEFDDMGFIRNQWVGGREPSSEESLTRQIIMEQMLMKTKIHIQITNGFLQKM